MLKRVYNCRFISNNYGYYFTYAHKIHIRDVTQTRRII